MKLEQRAYVDDSHDLKVPRQGVSFLNDMLDRAALMRRYRNQATRVSRGMKTKAPRKRPILARPFYQRRSSTRLTIPRKDVGNVESHQDWLARNAKTWPLPRPTVRTSRYGQPTSPDDHPAISLQITSRNGHEFGFLEHHPQVFVIHKVLDGDAALAGTALVKPK